MKLLFAMGLLAGAVSILYQPSAHSKYCVRRPAHAEKIEPVANIPSKSSNWKGDIPPAEVVVYCLMEGKDFDGQFREKGYSIDGRIHWTDGTQNYGDKTWVKQGVCSIVLLYRSNGSTVTIDIPNASKRNWLRKDLKNFFANKKTDTRFFTLREEDGKLIIANL